MAAQYHSLKGLGSILCYAGTTPDRAQETLRDDMLLVLAMRGGRPVAGALNFIGRETLFGRYWGAMAQDTSWNPVGFIVYDLAQGRTVAKRDIRGLPGVTDGIDYVTISPRGNYFVAGFETLVETWRPDAVSTLEGVERWLGEDDSERPFLLFVNLMTPHLPYRPPAEYQERFLSGVDPESIRLSVDGDEVPVRPWPTRRSHSSR